MRLGLIVLLCVLTTGCAIVRDDQNEPVDNGPRKEKAEPVLKPGEGETHVQGAAEWFTALRTLPLHNDLYDPVRSRRALLCVFNLSSETMNIPVRPEAIGAWKLRLSTDAVNYGGSGALIDNIPAERTPVISDAPKRLLERRDPLADQLRSVRLPAWTAAVFERDFLNDGATE